MNVVILNAGTGWHTDELTRALAERGHTAVVVPYERLVSTLRDAGRHTTRTAALVSDGISLFDADAVLARIIPAGSLEQIIFRVDALHWIEECGVPVINSARAIERCVDKFYTDARLRGAGLPTPETVVCEGMEAALDAIRALGDVVVKPMFGSLGHGMVRVSDPDVGLRVLQALDQVRAVFYVQRAIDHDGRDVRVFIVGGRVIGAVERLAPAGEWRTNVALGGATRAIDVPQAWADLARRAVAAVGADYAGVDLLPARDGSVYVLEVNGIPGWKGLQQATGVDVAGAIADHLVALVARRQAVAAQRFPV